MPGGKAHGGWADKLAEGIKELEDKKHAARGKRNRVALCPDEWRYGVAFQRFWACPSAIRLQQARNTCPALHAAHWLRLQSAPSDVLQLSKKYSKITLIDIFDKPQGKP
jgi:hypothetical protein